MKKQMYVSGGGTLQNKLGFTLIELLAVIVILAIIALIATPIVLNIIKDSKESATLQSAEFYLGAVETEVAKKIMDDPTFKPTSCEIQKDGNLKCDEKDVKVEINGEKPTSGTITLKSGKIEDIELMYGEKIITRQNGQLAYLKPGLYDEKGNLIATWDELLEKGIDIQKDYIDENGEPTIDDLSKLPGALLSQGELSKGTKLVIDSSVKKIGAAVFLYNENLTEIIISKSVTSIGKLSFAYLQGLTKIEIPDSVTNLGDGWLIECPNLKQIVLGDGIKSVDSIGFSDSPNLEKVIIGNGVTVIGDLAFANCSKLKEIKIGKGVTSIGDFAFENCSSLKNIVIPDNVTTLSVDLFKYCTSLTSITIPSSVTSIGARAFLGCAQLKNINYIGTIEQWNSINKGTDWDLNTPTDKIINYNYVIPQN